MKRVVFVRDKTNKHSIRALLAAYEKWFPEKDYYVCLILKEIAKARLFKSIF